MSRLHLRIRPKDSTVKEAGSETLNDKIRFPAEGYALFIGKIVKSNTQYIYRVYGGRSSRHGGPSQKRNLRASSRLFSY